MEENTSESASSVPPQIAEALAFLQAAEQSASSGDPARAAYTLQQYDQALAKLAALAADGHDTARFQAMAWVGRANVKRSQGPAGLVEALTAYDEAIKIIQNAEVDPALEAVRQNDLANVWTNRGIALLTINVNEKVLEAIANFDECIRIRQPLPPGPRHEYQYGLAAGWMNRADAYARLGTPEHLQEAVRSHDEAIAVIKTLPIEENDWFRHRLAVAHVNRGATYQTLSTETAHTEALSSYDESIRLLKNHRLCERHEGRHLLAATWLNRAAILLDSTKPEASLDAVVAIAEARALTDSLENEEPAYCDLGLKARHAQCRATLFTLANHPSKDAAEVELISSATDAVDEGLKLWRHWEKRELTAFRQPASELFRLGCLIYQKQQPQFLAEYVLENLDPERHADAAINTPHMHQTAIEIVSTTLNDLKKRGFGELGKPGMERTITTMGDLRTTEARLRDIRRKIYATQTVRA